MPHDLASGAKPAGPCCLVIFGAAGDLTKRLVVPALYNLTCSMLLPENLSIIGFDVADITVEKWRSDLEEMTRKFAGNDGDKSAFNQDAWNFLQQRMIYLRGDLTQKSSYEDLSKKLQEQDASKQTGGNYLFYLAIADRFFGNAITMLGDCGLLKQSDDHWRRIVIEKPFGHDLRSAQELDGKILHLVTEKQVYRIDHFLGKETVQNMMTFRFGNGFFEPLWNRDRIDHVQITVAESVGVEKRGAFYEHTGALRDMVPNHVFQLVSMTAMEAPNSFDADAVRSEKAKVFEAVRLCEKNNKCSAIRGQYAAGVEDGESVPGYRQEPGVSPESPVETYVAMKLLIDNWRWSGVPFYIRTGKRMARRKTQIAIRFKGIPSSLLRNSTTVKHPPPNWLLLHIQPDEGIALEFGAKIPGPTVRVGDVRMDFRYQDYFGSAPATGYETLLYDVMIGDATLFQRADNIEAGWRVVQPVLDAWSATTADLEQYAAGSQGPAGADELLARDGRSWRPIN